MTLGSAEVGFMLGKSRLLVRLAAGPVMVMGLGLAEDTYPLQEPPVETPLAVETISVAKGVTTTRTVDGKVMRHTADVVRWREWDRTFTDDALGGIVRYRMKRDEIATKVNGEESKTDGPLAGKIALGRKTGAGNRTFSLSERTAVGDQVDELVAMASIENRNWLPNRHVKIGETWEFTPQFVRAALRRDVPNSVAVGLAELVDVKKLPDGSREALVKLVIRGGGEAAKGPNNVVGAEGLISGNLTVNLERPGELVLRLNGTLVSEAQVGDADSIARVPITLRFESKPLK
ncbi:hypothetical protein [Haloferula helveola]|uniref:hypothetical protein n=1 Tax=Haloferula helveola TaxID=490095 RepID=UPI00334113D4